MPSRRVFDPSARRSNRWQGGRTIHAAGYVMVFAPQHERAGPNGYVFEHILVVEKALGHGLPLKARVHHVDENKRRNVGGNLVVCEDNGYHQLLHRRQRALDACGNPNAVRCGYCGKYDRQEEMYICPRKNRSPSGYHRDCGRDYERRTDGARKTAAL